MHRTTPSTQAERDRILRGEHEHRFGPFQMSRFAGTLHRPCLEPGCRVVSLDAEEVA